MHRSIRLAQNLQHFTRVYPLHFKFANISSDSTTGLCACMCTTKAKPAAELCAGVSKKIMPIPGLRARSDLWNGRRGGGGTPTVTSSRRTSGCWYVMRPTVMAIGGPPPSGGSAGHPPFTQRAERYECQNAINGTETSNHPFICLDGGRLAEPMHWADTG